MNFKRILAAVLCLVIVSVSAVLPSNPAQAVSTPAEWTVTYDDADINGDGTIKVLLIGNSYGLNLHEHMEKYLSQQEKPVLLGDLYSGGATIGDYYISDRNAILYYHSANIDDEPAHIDSITYREAVKQQKWDIIMIQSGVAASVDDLTFQTCLQPLVDSVRETFEETWGTESKYSLAWYFTWSRPSPDFCNNVEDYRNMVRVVRTYVEASNEFDAILPAGTLIQNMRTADYSNYGTGEKKNDGICSDGAHADSEFGCYALGYLYYKFLGLEGDPTILTEAGGNYLSINRNAIIKECVQNALNNPQQITESAYKVPLSERCTTGGAHTIEVKSVTEATCTKAGYTVEHCTTCGYNYKTAEVEALGHNYETEEKAATCTEGGYINRTCLRCGATDNEILSAGHNFTNSEEKRNGDNGVSGITVETCAECGIIRQSEEQTYDWDFESAYGPADYEEIKSQGTVYYSKSSFGGFDGMGLGMLADGKLSFYTYRKTTEKTHVHGIELLDSRQSDNTVTTPTEFSMTAGFYTEDEATTVAMVHSGLGLAKDESGYYSLIPSMQQNGTLKAYLLYSPVSKDNGDGTVQVSGGSSSYVFSVKAVEFCSANLGGNELDFSATSGSTYGPNGDIKGYIDNLIALGLISADNAMPKNTTTDEQMRLSIDYQTVNENGVITLNMYFNYRLSDGSVLTLCSYPAVFDSNGYIFNDDNKASYSGSFYTSNTHNGFTAAFGPAYFTSVSCSVNGYATVDSMSVTYMHTSETTACEHQNTYVSGGYSATCMRPGREDDTLCADCGTVVTAGKVIERIAHIPTGESTVVAATCVSDGGVEENCSTCKKSYLSTVYEKTGHKFELSGSSKATCTATGHDTWVCTLCGYEKTEEYAATGHSFGGFKIDTMPTVDADGSRYIECGNCSYRYYEFIPSIDLLDNAGDANGDGKADISDAVLIARHSAGTSTLSDYRIYIADVNADTSANISDAVLIARFSAGLATSFATGTPSSN